MNKGIARGKETNKEPVSILPAVRVDGSMDVQTHGKARLTAFPGREWTTGKEHEEGERQGIWRQAGPGSSPSSSGYWCVPIRNRSSFLSCSYFIYKMEIILIILSLYMGRGAYLGLHALESLLWASSR